MKKILFAMAVCGVLTTTTFAGSPQKANLFGRFVSFQVPPPAPSAVPQAVPQVAPPRAVPHVAPRAIPMPELSQAPAYAPAPSVMQQGPPMQLYHCVKVEDRDNIHPCAVTKIVAVKNPSARNTACGSCEPECVYVAICVPPYGCPKVRVSRHGTKVKYDYGKYEVDIKSKNGVIIVNYDD